MNPPLRLTFLYDRHCGVCTRFKDWLLAQPRHIATDFVPLDDPGVGALLPGIPPADLVAEIHAVSETGQVWRGADAWIMALWSTVAYRAASARLASPALRPLARRIALAVAGQRQRISRWLRLASEDELRALADEPPPLGGGGDGSCEPDRAQ